MPDPKKSTLHIDPPLAGTVKKAGFQRQGPYSTILSTNIWPVDATDNREVSATRPPLVSFESVSANINLLSRVTGDGNQVPQNSFIYAADGTLYAWNGSGFDQIDQAFDPGTVPQVTTGRPVYATPYLKTVIIANNGTPLIYDHTDQTVNPKLTYLTATVGNAPSDARILATWQGAIWFAGQPDTPHILYASRTGDPHDYDYTALPEDEGGAFATIGDNEGLLGEPITALMPQTTDTMVVGCIDSMWAIKGHPRRGGSVESISSKIGPLGQGAWAKAPDNTLYILTKSGVVTLAPQDGAIPSLISKEKVPNDIIGLDFDTLNPVVSMAYDTVWNGLIINVRGPQEQSWWFDPKYGGFHRMEFVSGYPTVMLSFPELDSATASGVLWGHSTISGDTPGLFNFDINGTSEVITYDFMVGPLKISPNAALKSKVETVKTVFGLHSVMDGNFIVWVGSDGEEAYTNAINNRTETGYTEDLMTLALNNGYCRPQLAGHAVLMEISGTDRIIFESADMDFIEAGRMRAKRNWAVAPRVSAGPDQRVEQTASVNVQLDGKVDSVVPVTSTWTKTSGPGTVTFTPNANTIDAIATITVAGTYVLTLTAYVTGEPSLTSSDSMTITTVANTAPVANAGPDISAFTNVAANLAGSATYTGFHPPVTYQWTDVGATGHVTFAGGGTSANNDVTINTAGTYTLRLTASDSASPPLSSHDDTTVTVQTNPGSHYVTATPVNPGGGGFGGSNVEYRVDLSIAGAPTTNAWWTNMAGANGEDIRVTDSSNNIIPFDVVTCNKAAKTGFLVYKRPVSASAAAVRIWTGGTAVKLAVNDTNGQYNAYRSDTLAFYPEGGGSASANRTRNSLNLNVVGFPTVTSDNSGPIGSNTTTYTTGSKFCFTQSNSWAAPLTLSAAVGVTLTTGQTLYVGGICGTNGSSIDNNKNNLTLSGTFIDTTHETVNVGEKGVGTSTQTASVSTAKHGTFYHYSGTVGTGGTSRTAVSDTASSTNSAAAGLSLPYDYLVIGAKPRLAPTTFSDVSTPISLFAINSGQLPASYLEYQGSMLDQAGFYGSWSYT